MCSFFLPFFWVQYLLEVLVTVDVLLVVGVLQLVGLHVLPQGLDDAGAGLGVNPQQTGQTWVQFELWRLQTHTYTHITLNNATSHQLNQKSWTVPLKPLHVCFNVMLNLQFVTNPNFGQKSFYPHNVLTAVALCRPHLVVQHQQQSAANAHISRPFHLEAVGLLCGRCAVPLKNTKQPFKLM